MSTVNQLHRQGVPVTQACQALGFPRSSYYYNKQGYGKPQSPKARSTPPRALSSEERDHVRQLLESPRFVDQSPRQVYATLLDEGVYHCSPRTMYRILEAHDEVKERRNQLQHPLYTKPQLMAEAPNQLWSWDITKLKSPFKFVYFYLYLMLDVYSRYIVGWMIADHESAELGQQLISHSCQQHQILPHQLTIHADNGGPMTALTTAQLLQSLQVQKTHSRPHTPNDNPFSESQFKTMKYRPDFPRQFDSLDQARSWMRPFVHWYNHEHYHSGLALLSPADVHFGRVDQVLQQRNATLANAYQKHPERFVRGLPQHPRPPSQVWINPPTLDSDLSNFDTNFSN